MGVAVELYFDPASEQHLHQLQTRLTAQGLPPILEQLGFRPHISLACFSSIPLEPIIPVVRAFAHSTQPFSITLSHIGTFPTTEGVVFVAPTVTHHLARVHQRFHQALAHASLEAERYYQPDQWVPHCTIATDLNPAQITTAFQVVVQEFAPIYIQCPTVGVITYRPVVLQAQFDLGS